MKKILITGANSYIGTSFETYIKVYFPNEYVVDTVDMMNSFWRERDFSKYDAIFHVAGIAHSDRGKIDSEKEKQYYVVNTDLTMEVARKAKQEGTKQFVFMSSIIVYGDSAPMGKVRRITKDTSISPTNAYGNSKVQAEKGLCGLSNEDFKVVILRPPMIYGRGCRGNYPILSKIAQKMPVFPYVHNERSMLYIENLCEFIRLMIENEEYGIFYPQNSEYSNTSELVKMISNIHGKKIFLVKGFGLLLKLANHLSSLVGKAFGSLSYSMEMSDYKQNYRLYDLNQSIKKTEKEYD